jgi:hypothetical protein
VFLITVMGFISLWTLQVFSGDVSGTHFTGTEQQKVIIMGLFASLLLLGLVSLIVGIYQLATGRRKRIFVWASLAVAFLVVIGGSLVLWLF